MKLILTKQLPEYGIPYTPTHIRRLVADGKFPVPGKHGGGGINAWFEDEILQYLARLRAERDAKAQVVQHDDGAFYAGIGAAAAGPFRSRKFAEEAAVAALRKPERQAQSND
jgi:hypothetical protein